MLIAAWLPTIHAVPEGSTTNTSTASTVVSTPTATPETPSPPSEPTASVLPSLAMLTKSDIKRVACTPSSLRVPRGGSFEITLEFEVLTTGTVGLGADGYDGPSADPFTGAEAKDEHLVPQGSSSFKHTVTVADGTKPGKYKLLAEVWSTNEVGTEGTDSIAEAACGNLTVT